MTSPFVSVPVMLCHDGRCERTAHPVVREELLEIRLNDALLTRIACAGIHLRDLALGYLKTEGLIGSMDDIASVEVVDSPPKVFLTTLHAPRGEPSVPSIMSSGAVKRERTLPVDPVQSSFVLTAAEVLTLMEGLLKATAIHEITRGTHCSALAEAKGLLCSREDIGRHNTIDMIIGHALMEGVDCRNACILTTGRISSEIVGKIRMQEFSVIISHSAPTSSAIELARTLGITLVGYVRNGRLRIYTHEQRILL